MGVRAARRNAVQPVKTVAQGVIMKRLKDRILKSRIWTDTSGQDLVEYALVAGLVAVAAVAAMPALSGAINNVFTKIASIINAKVV